jgi:WD40 repeat protein
MFLDWSNDIVHQIPTGSQDCNFQASHTVQVRKTFLPHPCASNSLVEIRDFCVDNQIQFLYGAAGDAFGCYKWDIETEQIVATYIGGGCIHSVDLIVPKNPSPILLLTGGVDGVLRIWDTSANKVVDSVDFGKEPKIDATSPQSQIRRSTTNYRRHPNLWITSCRARDENWYIVAGGRRDRGGFVATWHAPTKSLVSFVATYESIQNLAFYKNSATLLSVANESFISHWKNPLTLVSTNDDDDDDTSRMTSPVRQRVWTNQPSVYAVAVLDSANRIATGGVGSTVDVFERGTQCGIQLSTH